MKQLHRIVFYTSMIIMIVVVWFLPLHWILKVLPDLILLSIMFWVYAIDTAKEMPPNYGDDEYKEYDV